MKQQVELQCQQCNSIFKRDKNQTHHQSDKIYCSKYCRNLAQVTQLELECFTCKTKFHRVLSQINKSKSGFNFCSKSCAAKYNNTIKRKSRRSKCEKLLFDMLISKYPKLDIVANDKTMLSGYEIDIAIPSLQLAIEWNGIVHFKPIYGDEKLEKIKNRDLKKLELAQQSNIRLIVISDLVSTKEYVEETYNEIITIINSLIEE